MRYIFWLVLLIAFTAPRITLGEESAGRFTATITKELQAQYLVVTPKSYDHQKKYPLLIFLHGRGESGDDLDRLRSTARTRR